jgi:hypothetical protein
MLAQRRSRQIIQQFGEFAAALREKSAGRIELVGRLKRAYQRRLHFPFFAKLRGAGSANCEVRINLFAFERLYLIARVKNEQRRNLRAAR